MAVRPGRTAQKREHVSVQPLRSRPVNYDIRYSQNLQQQPRPSVFVDGDAEQTLGVQADDLEFGIEGRPYAQGAGALLVRGVKDLSTVEEGLVECVTLAITRIAENRDDLDLELVVHRTTELLDELVRVGDLKISRWTLLNIYKKMMIKKKNKKKKNNI